MKGKLEIELAELKGPITGLGEIEILIDGESELSLPLGRADSVEKPPGSYVVQLLLNGMVKRKSKKLKITIAEGESIKLIGKYSRLWGNMKLSKA